MRRVICLIAVLAMCAALACPVAAATDTFVPSISYKDSPEIVDAEMNEEDVTGCLVVSSIKECEDKTTDIYQEDRDLLLEVYEKLSDGSMELPLEDDYVIRELVDVSFLKTDCVEVPHGHKEWLAEGNTDITVQFDLGVKKTTEVIVMVYIGGEWIRVEDVVNNGDGTITCVFDDICPVAFCVEDGAEIEPPKTGDAAGRSLILWAVLMVASMGGVVVLLAGRRRFAR